MATGTNRNSRMWRLVSLVLSLPLLLPLRVASTHTGAAACFVTSKYSQTTTSKSTRFLVSSGFSFQDGEQVLVSVQKPLGIVLEERQAQEQHQDDSIDDGSDAIATVIFVAEMDPAGSASRAGVLTGDVLWVVQNASVENRSLEYVMVFLAQAPRVVNLRFLRQTT
jgi:C-terminal processing protease CtpA/Prc